MSDLAAVFAGVAEAAMALDPGEIRRRIDSFTDNGLRAMSWDARIRGGGGLAVYEDDKVVDIVNASSVERAALEPKTSREHAATAATYRHEHRFVAAVAYLAVRAHSRGVPTNWGAAVKDAHLMSELDMVADLERIDPTHTYRAVHVAEVAIDGLTGLHRSYRAKAPTRWQRAKGDGHRADRICDIHAQLTPPVYLESRNVAERLCRWCDDKRRQSGGHRPPLELVRLHDAGRQVDYRRALSVWLGECGAQVKGA